MQEQNQQKGPKENHAKKPPKNIINFEPWRQFEVQHGTGQEIKGTNQQMTPPTDTFNLRFLGLTVRQNLGGRDATLKNIPWRNPKNIPKPRGKMSTKNTYRTRHIYTLAAHATLGGIW